MRLITERENLYKHCDWAGGYLYMEDPPGSVTTHRWRLRQGKSVFVPFFAILVSVQGNHPMQLTSKRYMVTDFTLKFADGTEHDDWRWKLLLSWEKHSKRYINISDVSVRLSLALRVMGIADSNQCGGTTVQFRSACACWGTVHPGQETTLSALTMTSVQTKHMTASAFTHKTLKYEINGWDDLWVRSWHLAIRHDSRRGCQVLPERIWWPGCIHSWMGLLRPSRIDHNTVQSLSHHAWTTSPKQNQRPSPQHLKSTFITMILTRILLIWLADCLSDVATAFRARSLHCSPPWQSEQCHTILALLSRSIIVVSTAQGSTTPSDFVHNLRSRLLQCMAFRFRGNHQAIDSGKLIWWFCKCGKDHNPKEAGVLICFVDATDPIRLLFKKRKHLNHESTPISTKAKNRLHNLMDNNPEVIVEQETETSFFVASINQKHFFWIDKINDPHWSLKWL